VRKNGTLAWLEPDAKSQLTFRYVDNKPVAIDAVVLSTQHKDSVNNEEITRGRDRRNYQARAARRMDRPKTQRFSSIQPGALLLADRWVTAV
jgi:S-adenosylmethionine synthetase